MRGESSFDDGRLSVSYAKKELAYVKSSLKNTLQKHEQYTCVRMMEDYRSPMRRKSLHMLSPV